MIDGGMDDKIRIKDVSPISPETVRVDPDSKREKRRRRKRDEVKKHFKELADAAERLHDILVEHDSPYRFCVYQDKEEVLIDIVVLDEDRNEIQEVKQKNITHEEFITWADHIEKGGGLLIDSKA